MRLSKVLCVGALAAAISAVPLQAGPRDVAVGVQQHVTVNVNLGQNGVPHRIKGLVDYGSNLVYIKTEGLPKEGVRSKAQKRWTAREAAGLYAYRDLALMVVGMMVGGRIGAKRGRARRDRWWPARSRRRSAAGRSMTIPTIRRCGRRSGERPGMEPR